MKSLEKEPYTHINEIDTLKKFRRLTKGNLPYIMELNSEIVEKKVY